MDFHTPSTYTRVAIALHWVIAALLIAVLGVGVVMGEEGLLPDSIRFPLYGVHKSLGITILLLSCVRLGWRLTHPAPPFPASLSPWTQRVARAVHALFYVLMLGMPLVGWVIVSASTRNIPTVLYGVIDWPHLPLPASPAWRVTIGETAGELHETGAYLLLSLLLLHVGAALFHHIRRRDDTLRRMAPWIAARTTPPRI